MKIQNYIIPLLLFSPSAFAWDITGQTGIRSNYLWRGIDQNDFSPMAEVSADVTKDGFFAGAWLGEVDYEDGSNLEWDFYGGYNFQPISGINFSAGMIHYDFTDNSTRISDFNEGFIFANYGLLDIQYYFDMDSSIDVEHFLDIKLAIPNVPYVDVNIEYGKWEGGYEFTAINASKSFGNWNVGVQILDDAREGHFWDNAVVQVNYNF